ncbi:MAG: hypothetical protein KDA47_06180, partial [Planctomycetales bacterium]|nr:hypothetical protein [Planctomycetales bacterium]
RGLRYDNSGARGVFLHYSDVWYFDEPGDELVMLRKALRDPDGDVRYIAMRKLNDWVQSQIGGHQRVPWSTEGRRDVLVLREIYLNDIAEMVINMGLTDPCGTVAREAESVLRSLDPNKRRINLLRKTMDSGRITNYGASEAAKEVYSNWIQSPPPPVDPDDPFAH